MSTRRFFIDPAHIQGDQAILTGAEAHHLVKVLRLHPGDKVILLDGSGKVYDATVTAVSRWEARLHVLHAQDEPTPVSSLTLGVSLLKGGKMDLVVQKATELGINTILPFHSRYCDVKPGSESRRERWMKVAIEACKQCGRAVPPAISEVQEFPHVIENDADHELKCIFWEQADRGNTLRNVFTQNLSPRTAIVLVGPEGGFHPAETELAIQAGYQPISLGSRILRAETAALAATAIFQYELGNLSR